MTDFKQARENMVDCQIAPNGVTGTAILRAFAEVPREKFLPEALAGIAYMDEDISLGKGRFLMEPTAHARMMQELNPQPEERSLIIGAGTGYAAIILSYLAGHVTALEDEASYVETLKKLAKKLDRENIEAVTGKLTQGWAKNAPYDLIFLHGSTGEAPDAIAQQLKVGGRLAYIHRGLRARMGRVYLMQKSGAESVSSRPIFEAGCPYIPGFEPRERFEFGT